MSRDNTEFNASLTKACQDLKQKNTSTAPCFSNVCALLESAMKIAEQRDKANVDQQVFVDHATHVMAIAGNLTKMVATCQAIPHATAVTYVTGHKVRTQSLSRVCQDRADADEAFKKEVTLLFGETIAGFFEKNNSKRKQLCDQIKKTAADCEEAETLLNQRYSSKS